MYLLMKLGLISKEYLYSQHAANLAWLVRGVPIEQADTIWDWVLENEIIPHLRPEMIEIINEHKRKGHLIMLSSGSFSPLLEKVATYLDIEGAIATPLGEKEGKYTGRIIPPLNVGQGKVDLLKQFLDGPGKEINLDKSYFYTDSFVDLPVMEMFGNPVAVYPDEYLAKIARLQDWPIIGVEHQFG